MAGIYIKGMEMPWCEHQEIDIRHGADAKWYAVDGDWCEIIPVPPHGRLVDADALVKMFKEKAAEHGGLGGIMVALAAACIDAAPTIIAAEEKKE